MSAPTSSVELKKRGRKASSSSSGSSKGRGQRLGKNKIPSDSNSEEDNVTVSPAVTRSRASKLSKSKFKQQTNQRRKSRKPAVVVDIKSSSSSSTSEGLSPVLGKGLKSCRDPPSQNSSFTSPTNNQEDEEEEANFLAGSESDSVFTQKDRPNHKRQSQSKPEHPGEAEAGAFNSELSDSPAFSKVQVEVELEDEEETLFLLDRADALFGERPLHTQHRPVVRRRCRSLKGDSPLLKSSSGDDSFAEPLPLASKSKEKEPNSSVDDLATVEALGIGMDHGSIGSPENSDSENPSNLELNCLETETTPTRTGVTSRRKLSQLSEGACGSGGSPHLAKRKKVASMDMDIDPTSSNFNENSDDVSSDNCLSPVQLNSTPLPRSSASRSRSSSSRTVSPVKWNLSIRPGFQLRGKIAIHFDYIGHRDEVITCSGIPEHRYAVACRRCPAVLAGHTSSYSNLSRHLLTRHGIGRSPKAPPQPENSASAPVPVPYHRYHPKQLRYEMNCLRFTLLNSLPFQMARYDAFQTMVLDLDDNIRTISGKTLSRRMFRISNRAIEDNKKILKSVRFVSILVDGWTTKRNKGVIAAQAVFCTSNMKWGVRIIGLEELAGSHTGTAIRDCVNAMLEEHSLLDKVAAFVIDNGSNMVSAFDHFPRRKPFVHGEPPRPFGKSHGTYRCVAHTLQRVVKTADLGSISFSVKNAMLCIARIMSSQLLKKLLEVQTGRGFPKKSDTRWNCEYDIICLLVTGKMFNAVNSIINYALTSKDGSFFKNCIIKPVVMRSQDFLNLKQYCDLLEPLATATDRLQADGFTAHLVLPELLRCFQKITKVELESPPNSVASTLISEFLRRFASWFTDPILVVATFLDPWRKLHFFDYMRTFGYDRHLPIMDNCDILKLLEDFSITSSKVIFGINKDESPKSRNDATATAVSPENKAASQPLNRPIDRSESLEEYAPSSPTTCESNPSTFNTNTNSECEIPPMAMASGTLEEGLSATISLEIKAFAFSPIIKADVGTFWQEKKLSFPILANLFPCVMSRPSSTAPLERLFSKCGVNTRDKRTATLPSTLKNMLVTREWFEAEDEVVTPNLKKEKESQRQKHKQNETGADAEERANNSDSDVEVEDGVNPNTDGIDTNNSSQSKELTTPGKRPNRLRLRPTPGSSTSSNSSSPTSPSSRSSSSLLRDEFIDFDTALRMVLDDTDPLFGEGDDDEDAGTWECAESQQQGWMS